jgi:hypothetical protein
MIAENWQPVFNYLEHEARFQAAAATRTPLLPGHSFATYTMEPSCEHGGPTTRPVRFC